MEMILIFMFTSTVMIFKQVTYTYQLVLRFQLYINFKKLINHFFKPHLYLIFRFFLLQVKVRNSRCGYHVFNRNVVM